MTSSDFATPDTEVGLADVSATQTVYFTPACSSLTSPATGSTLGCAAPTTLSWTASTCATSYKVYFDQNPSPTTIVSTQAGTTYNTGSLSAATTYYWKIVPTNSNGDASGCSSIFSFTTGPSVITPPTAPDVARCGSGTVMLTASGGSFSSYFWFDDMVGGNLLSMTSSCTTPSLTTTRPYYVACGNIGSETSLWAAVSLSNVCSSASAASAQIFDITNSRSEPVLISRLSFCAGNTGTLNVKAFYRQGSFVGHESSSAGWIQIEDITGGITAGTPTSIDADDFVIPPGSTYGVYIYLSAQAAWMLSGSNNYSNSDITITTGAMQCGISAPFVMGSGALYPSYSVAGQVFYKNITCMSGRTECEAIISGSSTPSVSITANPGYIICSGSNVTFTDTPTNGGSTPSYQWKVNGGNVGSNSPTFSTSTLTTGNIVTCVLTPSAEACPSPATATSNAITMSVLPVTTITTDPNGVTLCQNGNTSFTVVASSGPYQWQVSANGGSTWTNITAAGSAPVYGGYTTATLTLTGVDDPNNGYQYRCLAGCTPSNVATLIVNPVSDPVSVGAGSCASPANITLSANGAGANEDYIWYSDAAGTVLAQTGGSSYTTPPISATTTYYVTKYNTTGSPTCESYPPTPVVATIYTAPVITTDPANESVSEGSSAMFSVSATGTTLTYQWQVSTNGGTVWSNITAPGSAPTYSGYFTNTLSLSGAPYVAPSPNYQYRCIVTGICSFTDISAAATLIVTNTTTVYTHPTVGLQNTYVGSCMANTCLATYYDDGGNSAVYSDNINNVFRTFCPNAPLKAVRATVSMIDVENTGATCNDVFYVQNGPGQGSPYLWYGCGSSAASIYTAGGAWNGGIFTSTHMSGCLTFKFSSGASSAGGPWDGWKIDLTCVDFAGGPSGTTNTDCINSTPICSDVTASSFTYGPGLVSDNCAGCVTTEYYTEWYYIHIATGGTVELEIVPNGSSDLDFAFYKADNCGALGTPLRCSYAARIPNGKTGMRQAPGTTDYSEDVSGDQWVEEVNVTAGEYYYLMINEWDKPNPNQYTLDWTLSNGASFNCDITQPLPVSLVDVYAERIDGAVQVTWITATETNNDYFTIERSADGIEFTSIGTLDGAGNSNQLQHYQFSDDAPLDGLAYYRIKQTDFDGAFSYSRIVSVDYSDIMEPLTVSVCPNPANDYITIKASRYFVDKKFKIFNILGTLIMEGGLNGVSDRVYFGKLPDGMYLLDIDGMETTRFCIINNK